jgi:hypothetical protein
MTEVDYIKIEDLKEYENINENESLYDYLLNKNFFTEEELFVYYYKEDLKEINFFNHEWNGVNYLQALKDKLFSHSIDNYRHRINLRIWDCIYDKNMYKNFDKDLKIKLTILHFMKHYNIIRNNSGRIITTDNEKLEGIQSNLAYLNRISIKKLYNYKLFTIQNKINNNLVKKIEDLENKNKNIYLKIFGLDIAICLINLGLIYNKYNYFIKNFWIK